MISKITDFKNSLNSDEIILYINTTGINQSKNHIYMVNILDGSDNKLKQYLSLENSTEDELIEFIFKEISNKKIISFNGKNYDLNFLNKKGFALNLNKKLESYIDIYLFIKRYTYFKEKTKSLDNLFYTLSNKKDIKKSDSKIIINEYKKLKDLDKGSLDYENLMDILFDFGKNGIIKRYFIYNYLLDYLNKRSKSVNILDEKFKYYIYNYKFNKDFLNISIRFLNSSSVPSMDILTRYSHIYSDNDSLNIKFNIVEGNLSLDDYGICIYTDLKSDNLENPFVNLKDNLIPISINDNFLLNNLEEIIYKTLINI